MKQQLHTHSPEFKTKVAFAALLALSAGELLAQTADYYRFLCDANGKSTGREIIARNGQSHSITRVLQLVPLPSKVDTYNYCPSTFVYQYVIFKSATGNIQLNGFNHRRNKPYKVR